LFVGFAALVVLSARYAADMSDDPTSDEDESRDGPLSAAVVDLLGVLCYGELTAFFRLSADAETAPNLSAKTELGRMAVVEFGHFERLRGELLDRGVDPEDAMRPFTVAIDAFHERTAPSTWLEGLVKAYVGDGIASDFYRELSAYLSPSVFELVDQVLDDGEQSEFVVAMVRGAIEKDPRISGRLALWGRRLVGEALSQAQQVAADRDELVALLVGSPGKAGIDLAELSKMFTRITESHVRRMDRLGLSA
jgi:hypothetical protein